MPFLQFKKFDFAVQAATVPTDGTIGGDDAVAWHDDRDRIPVVGLTDGAVAFGIVDSHRDSPITGGFPIGDVGKRAPDKELEGRTTDIKREIEGKAFACEIFPQLAFGAARQRERTGNGGRTRRSALSEGDLPQAARAGFDRDPAEEIRQVQEFRHFHTITVQTIITTAESRRFWTS
jgi:hypothetical protein